MAVNQVTVGNQDLRIYEQNGKYYVSHSSNNGRMNAGISTFDSAEEANEYIQSFGVNDSSLFFPEKDDNIIPDGAYNNLMGDAAKLLTQNSLLDIATDGQFSENVRNGVKDITRYSMFNIMGNADKIMDNLPSNGYSDAVRDGAKKLTENSLADFLTDGKYSENVSKTLGNLAKLNPIGGLINLFS